MRERLDNLILGDAGRRFVRTLLCLVAEAIVLYISGV